MTRKFIAICGSGAVGYHPLDRRTWSGLSFHFFTEFQRRGRLHRALGFDVPRAAKWFYMAKNFHPQRSIWRLQFYLDTAYRRALTATARRHIQAADMAYDFVQLGALFNTPEVLAGRCRCYSFHDSTVREAMASPYAPTGIAAWRVDRAAAFERNVYHGMEKIFTCGRYLRDNLVRDFGLPADKVVAIGAGINFDNIPAPAETKRYDTCEVLFVGADFARKGGRDLLQAFAIVRGRIPRARLHIVGPRHLTLPHDLQSGVTWHGFLNKADPAQRARLETLFRQCTLFVLPSLYEPFGVAPLEALAYEMPALVSRTGALRENITAGLTGDLVEPGNVGELAERMTHLLRDPANLQRMGRQGRQVVLEHHTWTSVADRFFAAVDPPPATAARLPNPAADSAGNRPTPGFRAAHRNSAYRIEQGKTHE